jgi:Fe-S-cluster containining protein
MRSKGLLLMACSLGNGTAYTHAFRSRLSSRTPTLRAALSGSAGAEPATPPARWRCAKNCGACCYLAPEERPGLEDWLSPADLTQYTSMVGADGWCVNYDPSSRGCTVYEDRPWFCRVSSEHFRKMFGVRPDEMDAFAIECCREHIDGIYGEDSVERTRFEREIRIAGDAAAAAGPPAAAAAAADGEDGPDSAAGRTR